MSIRALIPGVLVLSILAIPVVAQEEEPKGEQEKEQQGPSLKTLKKDLRKAIVAQDAKAVEEAIFHYRALGGRQAMRSLMAILPKIPTSMNTIYWQVVNGVAAFGDPEALDELGDKILANKSKAVARDLMFGLRNNRSTKVIPIHVKILAQGTADLQQMAIDQLTDIRVVESVDAIIAAMRADTLKSSVTWWATRALEIMTGANMGQDGERWHAWWQHRRAKGLPEPEEKDMSGMATDHLDPVRKYEFKFLKKMPKGQVIVLRTECPRGGCNFDNIEDILSRMDIPHTVVNRTEFEKPTVKLDEVMAIVVNCTQIKEHCICPTCKPGGTVQDRLYK